MKKIIKKNFPKNKINLKKIIILIYAKLLPGWVKYLKRESRDCNNVLDLGCGFNSPIQEIDIPIKVGVEMFDSYIVKSKEKEIHEKYIQGDILRINFSPKSYDIVFASEVIEHLLFGDGIKLLDRMELWARKKIILTTPNGFISQNGFDGNDLQEHKSGWTTIDFKKRGFRVYGMNGLKYLRGEMGVIKYKPEFFWGIISDISQVFVYFFPRFAFQLFVVKDIKK